MIVKTKPRSNSGSALGHKASENTGNEHAVAQAKLIFWSSMLGTVSLLLVVVGVMVWVVLKILPDFAVTGQDPRAALGLVGVIMVLARQANRFMKNLWTMLREYREDSRRVWLDGFEHAAIADFLKRHRLETGEELFIFVGKLNESARRDGGTGAEQTPPDSKDQLDLLTKVIGWVEKYRK